MPDPKTPSSWQWQAIKWGLTLLPINAILGVLPLVAVLFTTWWQRFPKLARSPLSWGWGGLTLWFLLTTVFAAEKGEALLGLANFLPYFALFLAMRCHVTTFQQLQQLAQQLTLVAIILIVLGLGQVYDNWQSPAWLSNLGTDLVAGGRPEGRISSLLMYANLFAAWLLLVFPLTVGLTLQSWWDWRHSTDIRPPLYFWGLLIALGSEAIALGLTNSRSAWGITLAIGIAYAVYVGWYWFVGGIAFIAATILWAVYGPIGKDPLRQIVPRFLWARFSDELYPDRYYTALRSTQWKFSWNMFLERPLTGWGLRNFTPFYKDAMGVWIGHPHNLPLMLLAEVGLVGTLWLLGLVGWSLIRAVIALKILWRFSQSARRQQQGLLLFSYVVGFGALCGYNLFDVALFDLRNNIFAWGYLAAIAGVSDRLLAQLSRQQTMHSS